MSLPDVITPEELFHERRRFIRDTGVLMAGATLPLIACAESKPPASATVASDVQTSQSQATSINNFYEFGLGKSDPSRHAHTLITDHWKVSVEGEVRHPQVFDLTDLIGLSTQEERVYRLRCVETWSMVIPWQGYSLAELIKKVEPGPNARFVEFHTLADPKQMPGLNTRVLNFPYVEALRLDEAMHPLTLLCFGMYGKPLPKQNGAPVRIVVPWKYGFKSGKSITKIRFVHDMPQTSWMRANGREYGFYANVNPNVPHPRWSQAYETRVGENKKRPTLLFNGYDEVAPLYAGMDLRENY